MLCKRTSFLLDGTEPDFLHPDVGDHTVDKGGVHPPTEPPLPWHAEALQPGRRRLEFMNKINSYFEASLKNIARKQC